MKEGKLHPGPHAKFDATRLQEQIHCEHPFDELLWSGNKSGSFAKRVLCKLTSIIAYKVLRFRFAVSAKGEGKT